MTNRPTSGTFFDYKNEAYFDVPLEESKKLKKDWASSGYQELVIEEDSKRFEVMKAKTGELWSLEIEGRRLTCLMRRAKALGLEVCSYQVPGERRFIICNGRFAMRSRAGCNSIELDSWQQVLDPKVMLWLKIEPEYAHDSGERRSHSNSLRVTPIDKRSWFLVIGLSSEEAGKMLREVKIDPFLSQETAEAAISFFRQKLGADRVKARFY